MAYWPPDTRCARTRYAFPSLGEVTLKEHSVDQRQRSLASLLESGNWTLPRELISLVQIASRSRSGTLPRKSPPRTLSEREWCANYRCSTLPGAYDEDPRIRGVESGICATIAPESLVPTILWDDLDEHNELGPIAHICPFQPKWQIKGDSSWKSSSAGAGARIRLVIQLDESRV